MYLRTTDLFRDRFGVGFPIPMHSFGTMIAAAILVGVRRTGRELD